MDPVKHYSAESHYRKSQETKPILARTQSYSAAIQKVAHFSIGQMEEKWLFTHASRQNFQAQIIRVDDTLIEILIPFLKEMKSVITNTDISLGERIAKLSEFVHLFSLPASVEIFQRITEDSENSLIVTLIAKQFNHLYQEYAEEQGRNPIQFNNRAEESVWICQTADLYYTAQQTKKALESLLSSNISFDSIDLSKGILAIKKLVYETGIKASGRGENVSTTWEKVRSEWVEGKNIKSHAQQMAMTLTSCRVHLVAKVPIEEFSSGKHWESKEKLHLVPNLKKVIERTNHVQAFVEDSLLKEDKDELAHQKRAHIMEGWIVVMDECYKMGNFQDVLDIYAGVNSVEVGKKALEQKIWSKMKKEYQDLLDKFNKMYDSRKNHSTLRRKLKEKDVIIPDFFITTFKEVIMKRTVEEADDGITNGIYQKLESQLAAVKVWHLLWKGQGKHFPLIRDLNQRVDQGFDVSPGTLRRKISDRLAADTPPRRKKRSSQSHGTNKKGSSIRRKKKAVKEVNVTE